MFPVSTVNKAQSYFNNSANDYESKSPRALHLTRATERDIKVANQFEPKKSKKELIEKLGVIKPSLPFRVIEKIDKEMQRGLTERKDSHVYEGPEFPGGIDLKKL